MSQGCAVWRDNLGAYVIGALDSEERPAMRRHLATCPACRTDYEDLLPVRDWLTRTKRHLAVCLASRTDYEDLFHLRLAFNRAAGPDVGRCPGSAMRAGRLGASPN
jgi:anti-sigma factor RsiW